MPKLSSTIFGRKLLFEELLSAELGNCSYKIEAFYEAKRNEQIFSLSMKNNQKLMLGINLSEKREPLFNDCERSAELSILYRSYFISSYIHALEASDNLCPSTYFSGLVTLEAIIFLNSGKKITVFSPLSEKIIKIKPIDIHSALNALNRIIISHSDMLTERAKAKCEEAVSSLISYTSLPEVTYKSPKKAVFTFLEDLCEFKSLWEVNTKVVEKYPIFKEIGMNFGKDITLTELILKSEEKNNLFWAGIGIRLLAYMQKSGADPMLCKLSCFKKSLLDFGQSSVVYFKEQRNTKSKLLKSNMTAIKRLAANMENLFYESGEPQSGTLHYNQ